MKKTLIVTDSTSSLSWEDAEKLGIEIIPLSVIVDGKEYKDVIEISGQKLLEEIESGKVPTTSQPNLGYIQERMEAWKKENYDQIIIFTISSKLSGTHQAYHFCKNAVELENVYIVDTGSLCAVLSETAIKANQLAKEGLSAEEIIEQTKHIYEKSDTYIYPGTLEQLKRGGRLNPAVATVGALLKIKVLLSLEGFGNAIEKHSVHRTEKKLVQTIFDDLKKKNINGEEYDIFVASVGASEVMQTLKAKIKEEYPTARIIEEVLPAVLVAHTGNNTIGLQYVKK